MDFSVYKNLPSKISDFAASFSTEANIWIGQRLGDEQFNSVFF